jgi:hypothetical protein
MALFGKKYSEREIADFVENMLKERNADPDLDRLKRKYKISSVEGSLRTLVGIVDPLYEKNHEGFKEGAFPRVEEQYEEFRKIFTQTCVDYLKFQDSDSFDVEKLTKLQKLWELHYASLCMLKVMMKKTDIVSEKSYYRLVHFVGGQQNVVNRGQLVADEMFYFILAVLSEKYISGEELFAKK